MRSTLIVLVLCLSVTAAAGCGSPAAPATAPSAAWSAQLCDDIVFAASSVENKLPAHAYCVNDDGSGLRPLTRIGHPLDASDHWEIRPHWSPDGTRIAMVSETQHGILIVQPNGIVVRVAASVDYYADQWPAWSPDGSRLAYVDSEQGISVVDADGLYPRQIAPPFALHPSWSPDGTRIAYVRTIDRSAEVPSATPADTPAESNVMIVAADGGEPTSIISRTATVGTLGAGSAGFGTPEWSPDGSMVAVRWENVTFGDNPLFRFVNAIVAATADGARQFVYAEDNASGPGIWSQDGRVFFYPRPGAIFAVEADGTNRRDVVGAHDPFDLTLSPDGSRIAYADDAGVSVLHLNGMINRRIASWEDGLALAGWSPAGNRLLFWVKTDSRYVVSDFFLDAIVELRVVNEDGSGLTTIAKGLFLDSMSSVIPAHAEWRPQPGE